MGVKAKLVAAGLGVAEAKAVARRLMRLMAHEDLVESHQPLPVVMAKNPIKLFAPTRLVILP